eukprot:4932968-Prymnesium_polylepis.2
MKGDAPRTGCNTCGQREVTCRRPLHAARTSTCEVCEDDVMTSVCQLRCVTLPQVTGSVTGKPLAPANLRNDNSRPA